MATATFVKSARKDIYSCGKRVELVHQKGNTQVKSILRSTELNREMRMILS
jgi:hypothetical protein